MKVMAVNTGYKIGCTSDENGKSPVSANSGLKSFAKKSFFLLVSFLFVFGLKANAQTSDQTDSVSTLYDKVDVPPEFPGGMRALGKYIDGKNHYYPKEARDNKIQGKVIVEFIINEDGTPSDFLVIQGVGYGCDEAAVEAFKKMPKWKPGTVNGQPVKVRTRMGYLYKL